MYNFQRIKDYVGNPRKQEKEESKKKNIFDLNNFMISEQGFGNHQLLELKV